MAERVARTPSDPAPRSGADRDLAGSDLAFVVGCPRSGTTWVQLLLAQHPAVTTTQETHLFQRYLGPLERRWRREMRAWEDEALAGERGYGLSPLLDAPEFDELCRAFARGVLDRARGAPRGGEGREPPLTEKPEARVLVEKTPGHLFHARFIHRLFPAARFVHVVRDPRAVTASLLRAGQTWWGGWAPRGAAEAARWWTEHVEAGLRMRSEGVPCRTVFYERLHEDAPGELLELLGFLDLPAEAAFCRRAADRCRLERLRSGAADVRTPRPLTEAPGGFYARGRPAGWRDELRRGEAAAVEHEAGPLMRRLGYRPVTRAGRTGRRPWRSRARTGLETLRAAVDAGIDRLLTRL